MNDDRYNNLKKKYDALLEENEYLKAKVTSFPEAPINIIFDKDNFSDGQLENCGYLKMPLTPVIFR